MTRPATKIKAVKKPAHVHSNIIEVPHNHGYFGPVVERNSGGWNPAAHGKDCIVEVCECHAVRWINVRGDAIEAGKWQVDLPCASYHLQLQAADKISRAAEALAIAVKGECDTAVELGMLAQALAELDAAARIDAPPKRARAAAAA